MVAAYPEVVLEVMNGLLREQEFPKVWKEAKVILLWKREGLENPSDFHPICLLNVLEKLFGNILKERLEAEIETKGGISPRQ